MGCLTTRNDYFSIPVMPKKLRLIRTARGIGQTALAKSVGISQPYLALIETGRRKPSARVARKLAAMLQVDVGWLFSEEVGV